MNIRYFKDGGEISFQQMRQEAGSHALKHELLSMMLAISHFKPQLEAAGQLIDICLDTATDQLNLRGRADLLQLINEWLRTHFRKPEAVRDQAG